MELWQADSRGCYLHRGSANRDRRDPNFLGFGRVVSDTQGRYYFRTIKPVAYPGRTPHLHMIVKKGTRRLLTTQLYVRGDLRNQHDPILGSIRDPRARESVLADFRPVPGSRIDELTAQFDIIIGLTAEDPPWTGHSGRDFRTAR